MGKVNRLGHPLVSIEKQGHQRWPTVVGLRPKLKVICMGQQFQLSK